MVVGKCLGRVPMIGMCIANECTLIGGNLKCKGYATSGISGRLMYKKWSWV